MFHRFWFFVSSIGIQQQYDDKLIKRITLTNQFSVIATVIFILSGLNNFVLGDTFSALLIEGFAFLCIIGFIINHRHFHRFAITFLFTAISVAIFYFDSYSGILSGTYLYHFPIILAIAFVFDFKEDKKIMFFHFALILAFLMINVLTRYTLFKSNFITDDKRYQMFMFNLMFSSASVGFFIYLTVKNNLKESDLYHQRIAERELAETTIKQALAEKEILLTELHHRVKNNMAIISGLFSLKINSATHADVKSVLVESRNRVRSMALIHNRLYTSYNFSQVNFDQYVAELIKEIKTSYPALSSEVVVNAKLSSIVLNMNVAVPCGLILNELLTNCYKHAFSGRKDGCIDISIIDRSGVITLMVKDNGSGLHPDYQKRESLGMVVVESLCEQLEGNYSFSSNNGTLFELTFKNAN